MQFIVGRTSFEESNKRVAGHMPRKTLVRKLDQLVYSRDEISFGIGHSNIKSLDSNLDTLNERKSTERLWLQVVFRGKLCRCKIQIAANSNISSATQLAFQASKRKVLYSSAASLLHRCVRVLSLILEAPLLPIYSCISFLSFTCRLLEIK